MSNLELSHEQKTALVALTWVWSIIIGILLVIFVVAWTDRWEGHGHADHKHAHTHPAHEHPHTWPSHQHRHTHEVLEDQ